LSREGYLIAYEVEDDGFVELKYDMTGVPAAVLESGFHTIAESLNQAEVEAFSAQIDEWATGKPFAAFPISGTSDSAGAVLCVAGTRPFHDADFEVLMCVSGALSLVIPTCIESAGLISVEEAGVVLEDLPRLVAGFRFESLEADDAVAEISGLIRDKTRAKLVSVYAKAVATGEITRLVSLTPEGAASEDFVTTEFVAAVFDGNEPMNETDCGRVPHFGTID